MTLQLSTPKRLIFLLTLLSIAPLTSCQIERERAGELPDVNVSVDPGRLPKFDVQGPDVKVGVTERTVTVPKVIVVQEQETVKVPYIDVDVPGADRQERTITTEVEVPSPGYNITIEDAYSVNNELWVISSLQETNPNAARKATRVSDRLVINAPDVPVRHFIVGKRPNGTFNEQYNFIGNVEQIQPQLKSGRQLYTNTAST